MQFLPANAQHIGDRRTQQDSFGFGDPENREFVEHGGFLAVVCDGMGGMEFGDAASRAATRAFLDAYQAKIVGESIPAALERSVRTANDAVVALAHSYGLTDGMGTTLVAAALHRASLYYISVGDSGLFLSRGDSLPMLNRPHVFANLLDAAVARGTMLRADAETHPERESLTSFIGTESLEEIDRNLEPFPLEAGDAILLASDGLFKTLSPEEMIDCLVGNPQTWPEALVATTIAKKREHQDNVTVLSIAVEADDISGIPFDPRTVRRSTTVPPAPVTRKAETTLGSAGLGARATSAAVPATLAATTGATPASAAPNTQINPGSADLAGATSAGVAARASASRSRSPMLIVVAILMAAAMVAALGVWWFQRLQSSKLKAQPVVSGPDSTVSAPPAATPRPEIKVDPDAPIARPTAPSPKASPEAKPK
jgi:PPM family protein phosphatase